LTDLTLSLVVPTVGGSPYLVACLEALRRDGGPGGDGAGLELIVVDQSPGGVALPAGLADRVLRPDRNLGFAGGTNLGLRAAAGELLATVNDDALVEPGWAMALAGALAAHPRAAAAQGVNVRLDDPRTVDGWGLAWNRRWQAVQLGHGAVPPAAGAAPREVFGVSATAAVYRREALHAAALPDGGAFDARLGSYYEDAELAGRLRAAGWTALSVPAARARHAGSTTAGPARWAAVYGNRYLALARLLGSGLWPRLPALLARDLLDLLRAAAGADLARLAGIPAGWARAAPRLPAFARRRGPEPPLAEIARLRVLSGDEAGD
jgi:hypothetical protein